ncbi:MAG TPA: serine hydrolase [Planctomycetota bacterium]|nr:serine hydrolase [Planctomycetota bacterium]
MVHATFLRLLLAAAAIAAGHLSPAQTAPYFPPAGTWAKKRAAEVGMDQAKLDAAIAFAVSQPTDWPKDFSRQQEIFGSLLGPMPEDRADTNGLVIRRGYVVAEFGETGRVDPTYSVAKSMLATVALIAVRDHRIPDLDAPVAELVHDGGYDSKHNRAITWRHHLQQESEWQGSMWGKAHDFIGAADFGSGARPPRELREPGTFFEYNDVRINRFALSLLRVFGRSVPDVFRDEVMDPIGASKTWRWVPYDAAVVDIDGAKVPSVSGGTRWGGGVWISSQDMARFGCLWLRGGRWGERQIVPPELVARALEPSAHGPDYGFLWWLDTRGENWPDLPKNAFGARGAGNNTIFVSPDHDLVVVWRWHSGKGHADARFFRMLIDAIER